MKLFVSRAENGSVIIFTTECQHNKKIIRFSNGILVACKKEKKPVALYLNDTSPEEALDFITYFADKCFLSELADSPYIREFLGVFSNIEEVILT